jgi:hypothetical protein
MLKLLIGDAVLWKPAFSVLTLIRLRLNSPICDTKLYISTLKKGKSEDSEREALIAKLWHNAAVAMRRFDANLADKFFLKGDYWTEPASWTNADVKKAGITIDEMHEVCRQLILDKK